MPEDKSLTEMTDALRTLNELKTLLEETIEGVSCRCPVCTTMLALTKADISSTESQRQLIIESVNLDETGRNSVIYMASWFAAMMLDKAEAIRELTAQAKAAQQMIFNVKVRAIALGEAGTSNQEMLRRAIESAPAGPERENLRSILKSMQNSSDPNSMN